MTMTTKVSWRHSSSETKAKKTMKFRQYYYCFDTLLNVQNEEMLIDAPIKNQFFLSGKSSHPSKQKPQPNQDLTKKRNKQKKIIKDSTP